MVCLSLSAIRPATRNVVIHKVSKMYGESFSMSHIGYSRYATVKLLAVITIMVSQRGHIPTYKYEICMFEKG